MKPSLALKTLFSMEVVPKPGHGCPMWASEILASVKHSMMFRALTEDLVHEARNELRDILAFQSYARGARAVGQDIVDALTIESSPAGAYLSVPEWWTESVDRHFMNTVCPRCDRLLTRGIIHDGELCDLDLADLILSS